MFSLDAAVIRGPQWGNNTPAYADIGDSEYYPRNPEAVLTSTYNLCFEQKYEKYQRFLSENFQFLEVKFSTYLHMRVFVMNSKEPGWREHSHIIP